MVAETLPTPLVREVKVVSPFGGLYCRLWRWLYCLQFHHLTPFWQPKQTSTVAETMRGCQLLPGGGPYEAGGGGPGGPPG